jgi:hypothetical protein
VPIFPPDDNPLTPEEGLSMTVDWYRNH